MPKKALEVPERLQGTFKRLMWQVPPELRDNEEVQKATLVFLKVGGEKLAKARIKAFTTPFSEKFILKKMQLRDDDLLDEVVSDENADENEAESDEDTDDISDDVDADLIDDED